MIRITPFSYQELSQFTYGELSKSTYADLQGILNFKTDWNVDDYYNFEDLNKVEIKTRLIRELVEYFKGIEINFETKENRTINTIEFAESINRLENNIKLLGGILNNPTDFIEPKTYWWYNTPFSYEDANRLEKNLKTLYVYTRGNIFNFRHCGAYTCGAELI